MLEQPDRPVHGKDADRLTQLVFADTDSVPVHGHRTGAARRDRIKYVARGRVLG